MANFNTGSSVDQEKLREQNKQVKARKQELVENWSRHKSWGSAGKVSGVKSDSALLNRYATAANMMERSTAWFEKHRIDESAVISADFPVTPEFVRKVSRIGGANSNRSQWVQEWPAQTMHDAVYFINYERNRTVRGSTKGDSIYRQVNAQYSDERTNLTLGTGDGVTTSFTITAASTQGPIRPKFVEVYVDGTKVGYDDGAGGFSAYAGEINTSTSSIDYTAAVNGAVVFTTAPASGAVVSIRYAYNSEDATAFAAQRGQVGVSVTRKQFEMHPQPIGYEFHDFAALYVETTGVIDDLNTELISVIGDLHAADMDYRAIFDIKALAKRNPAAEWDARADSRSSYESYKSHAQGMASVIEYVDNTVYEELKRTGRGNMIAGSKARTYLTNHEAYQRPAEIVKTAGSFLDGSLMGRDVYGAPSDGTTALEANEILWTTQNPDVTSDAALIYGVYAPLISELKYPNHINEGTISTIEGKLEVTPQLTRRIIINSAPAY
jgi:hypothetical protein